MENKSSVLIISELFQVKTVFPLGFYSLLLVPPVLAVMNLVWFYKIVKGLIKTVSKATHSQWSYSLLKMGTWLTQMYIIVPSVFFPLCFLIEFDRWIEKLIHVDKYDYLFRGFICVIFDFVHTLLSQHSLDLQDWFSHFQWNMTLTWCQRTKGDAWIWMFKRIDKVTMLKVWSANFDDIEGFHLAWAWNVVSPEILIQIPEVVSAKSMVLKHRSPSA